MRGAKGKAPFSGIAFPIARKCFCVQRVDALAAPCARPSELASEYPRVHVATQARERHINKSESCHAVCHEAARRGVSMAVHARTHALAHAFAFAPPPSPCCPSVRICVRLSFRRLPDPMDAFSSRHRCFRDLWVFSFGRGSRIRERSRLGYVLKG